MTETSAITAGHAPSDDAASATDGARAATAGASEARPECVRFERAAARVGGRTIWSEVTLAVDAGEFVAVLGPNGAGKSTLIKATLGLLPVSAGTATVLGRPPGEARSRIGYLPQRRNFDAGTRIRGIDLVRLGFDGARWEEFDSRAPVPPWGHPDFLLLGAIDAGVISEEEAKLIATRHEDSGRVFQGVDGLGIVRLFAGFRPHTGHFDDPDPTKDMAIEVGRRAAEGGRGADDPNVSLGAAGELDEA